MAIVYRFRMWDIINDCYQTSRRWATKERIESMGAEIEGDGIEVNDSLISREYAGMTDRGYDPRNPPRVDFGGAPR
jgi:hypothetical protein